MRKLILPLTAAAALCLGAGCASEEEIAMANAVTTALPEEIKGCKFMGDVDVGGHATIENARFSLKLKTAKLGANFLVETHAYAQLLALRSVGVALSGRAYKCPADHALPEGHEEKMQERHAQIKERAVDDMDKMRLRLMDFDNDDYHM